MKASPGDGGLQIFQFDPARPGVFWSPRGEVLDFHNVPELRESGEQMQRWQTLGAALRSDLP